MKVVTQLSVFVANRPGTLAHVCDELAATGINIYALTISDTADHAVIRLVLDDHEKALDMFEERGTLVIENEVLFIEGSNEPGSLSLISSKLAAGGVNIEYAYLATHPDQTKGLLILRPSDIVKAQAALA